MESERTLNNKGYTLVELMVTILITGMVVGIITVFISASRTSYDLVRTEVVLQQEAKMASSYIGDIAIEASQCTTAVFTSDGKNYKVLTIKAPDPEYVSGERYNYYFIILWEESTQTLRFCKVKDDAQLQADGSYTLPAGTELVFLHGSNNLDYASMLSAGRLNIIGNKRALLARYVTGMDVVLPDAAMNSRLTQITFRLNYHGKEYVLTKNVTGRNLD